MGTVIEINENIVTVKFEDGSLKKYLKENFIREPFLNQNVLLNKNGTLIDLKEKRNNEKKRNIILIIILIIVLITFFLIILYKVVNSAMQIGNEVNSCLVDENYKKLKEKYEKESISVFKQYMQEKYNINIKINKVDVDTYWDNLFSLPDLTGFVHIDFSYKRKKYKGFVNLNDNDINCYDNYESDIINRDLKEYIMKNYNYGYSDVYIDWGNYNSYKYNISYNKVQDKYNGDIKTFLDSVNKIVFAYDDDYKSHKNDFIKLSDDLDVSVYSLGYKNEKAIKEYFNVENINLLVSYSAFDDYGFAYNSDSFFINEDNVFPVRNIMYIKPKRYFNEEDDINYSYEYLEYDSKYED